MGWVKRNLFFAIGGIVTLGLLGAAGFYDYVSWSHNKDALNHLTEVVNSLKQLNQKKPLPGSGQVDNIKTAGDQERQLRQWIAETRNFFKPIDPIPKPASGAMTDPLFANALHRTLAQLKSEADTKNVALPPDFNFSFTAHVDRLTFAPGSLGLLSVQLGEVKTISEVFFDAGINALDAVQRLRVSADDAIGTDYLDDLAVTNDLAVLVPYQVTFRAFSPEIARVLEGFASSAHGFVVRTLSVQPASPTSAVTGPYANPYQAAYGAAAGLAAYRAAAGGAAPAPATPLPGKGGLQTVLDEQLLSVTLKVEVVKLTPRN